MLKQVFGFTGKDKISQSVDFGKPSGSMAIPGLLVGKG
jgi:hypothetical protein